MIEANPVQVVVAYDMSPSSELALARAVEVAARAPQHVLHVVLASRSSYEAAAELHDLIRERVSLAFHGRPTASEIHFFIHVRIGKPAETILEVAEDVGADLLFIGSHNKHGLERMLLGSVSEHVVRAAKCPVMVVRPKAYQNVERVEVYPYEHVRATYSPPHRYSYDETRVIARPADWPLS